MPGRVIGAPPKRVELAIEVSGAPLEQLLAEVHEQARAFFGDRPYELGHAQADTSLGLVVLRCTASALAPELDRARGDS